MGAYPFSPSSGEEPAFCAVVVAAGTGRRMGGRKKPFLPLAGKPILLHAVEALTAAPGCVELVIVVHPDEYDALKTRERLKKQFGATALARGGPSRQASALSGLEALRSDAPVVLIHDAVRPLVDPAVVRSVARAAHRFGAAIAAVPATETIKQVDAAGRILDSPPRDGLWLARSPQGFRRELILRAHREAVRDGFVGTDDAQLVERSGAEVRVVRDTYENVKITTEQDLAAAEGILRWRESRTGGHP